MPHGEGFSAARGSHLPFASEQPCATAYRDKKPCELSACASSMILDSLAATKAHQDQLGDLVVKFCFLSPGFDGTFVLIQAAKPDFTENSVSDYVPRSQCKVCLGSPEHSLCGMEVWVAETVWRKPQWRHLFNVISHKGRI